MVAWYGVIQIKATFAILTNYKNVALEFFLFLTLMPLLMIYFFVLKLLKIADFFRESQNMFYRPKCLRIFLYINQLFIHSCMMILNYLSRGLTSVG